MSYKKIEFDHHNLYRTYSNCVNLRETPCIHKLTGKHGGSSRCLHLFTALHLFRPRRGGAFIQSMTIMNGPLAIRYIIHACIQSDSNRVRYCSSTPCEFQLYIPNARKFESEIRKESFAENIRGPARNQNGDYERRKNNTGFRKKKKQYARH